MERMKRIENPNVRGVRTQGIVRAAGIIRIFIVSSPAVESPLTVRAGLVVAGSSSSLSKC